jgi:enoyl-CoA hydratase/carnithine racemase
MPIKEWKTVYVEAKKRVAWIYLNRPKDMNAINLQLIDDLFEAAMFVDTTDDFDVVVLTGAGDKAFCGGGDLKMIHEETKNPEDAFRMLSHMWNTVFALKNMGKPLIGRVNGLSIGGAGEFLMPCDIIIAAEHAKFMLGETNAGAVPAIGSTQWLGLSIGEKRAKYMLMTDEMISAQTMYVWGLLSNVVPMEKLDAEVDRVANLLCDRAPWALRLIKSQTNTMKDLGLNNIMAGRDSWTLLTMVPDLAKSCEAFMNKGRPRWAAMREEQLKNKTNYYYWGPLQKSCGKCGAKNLPETMTYCGLCGEKL